MADHTLTADQIGAYEINLTAGKPYTLAIENRTDFSSSRVQVSVHEADAPVYARFGDAVAPRDPNAYVVPVGTWLDLPAVYGTPALLSLISDAAATISIARA